MVPGPTHFDRMAELYHRARPPYAEALWERLARLGVLRPGVRVLELGAGTGQATGRMLAEGASVTAVEPGAQLAELLRRNHRGAEVLEMRAEDVVVDPGSFDLVAVATAVHWLDLDVVLPMAHRALAPGGSLAVWRNAYGDPDAPGTPFRDAVQRIVARRNAPPRPGPDESDTAAWARRLESGGLFRAAEIDELRWTVDLDAARIRDLFTTFSDWTADEALEASHAVTDLGGTVTGHYVTPLIVLERVDGISRVDAPR